MFLFCFQSPSLPPLFSPQLSLLCLHPSALGRRRFIYSEIGGKSPDPENRANIRKKIQ